MKIIKVTSCCKCPNHIHIIDLTCNPNAFNRYVCRKSNRTLASKCLEQIIKPMTVCTATQEITTGITVWKYSADGKTKWDGSIPNWCRLDDYEETL